jgi:hypothetical protein
VSAETGARQQALNEVGDALRTLAANLIGIVRGAGKPLEVNPNVESFAAALSDFEQVAGGHPKAWEFADMLRADLEPKVPASATAADLAEAYAQHDIIQASLQLAAARLLKEEAGVAEAFSALRKTLTGLEETKRKIAKGDEKHIDAQLEAKTNGRSG